MNQEVKTKWVEALRSGEYEQCGGALCKNGAYCCLGVLCEIMGLESTEEKSFIDEEEYDVLKRYSFEDSTSAAVLPYKFAQAIELHPEGEFNVFVESGGFYKTLAGLNDSGVSFDEIADIIEENF